MKTQGRGGPLPVRFRRSAAIEPKFPDAEAASMDDDTQLWGGAGLIVLGGLILFAPLVLDLTYTSLLLAVAVLVLAAGSVLVGLSQRGRAV